MSGNLRVLFLYTQIFPPVIEALDRYAPDAEKVYTGNTVYDYWNAIAQRWTGESDLVTIEHDNEIEAHTLQEFDACDNNWCTFWYWGEPSDNIGNRIKQTQGIGCAKFSAALQRGVPIERFDSSYGSREWSRADRLIMNVLHDVRNHGQPGQPGECGWGPHCHGEGIHHGKFERLTTNPDENGGRTYKIVRPDKEPYIGA